MDEPVKIILDNCDNNSCYPGQTIVGKVKCFFKKEEKVRRMLLKFKGTATTKFPIHRGKHPVTYYGTEIYFDQEYNLVSGGDDFHLAAGKHVFPFSYILPTPLPAPFSTDFGQVEYSIKVTVDRPWKVDYEDELTLDIISLIDLNSFPESMRPICTTVDKEVGVFGADPLKLEVSLLRTGFVAEQDIHATVAIKNKSSVDVQHVRFRLIQDSEYIGHSLKPEKGLKELEIIYAEWKIDAIIGQGHTEKSFTTNLTIPRKRFPNLGPCSLINVTYRLEVKLSLPFPHSSLYTNVPLTMGTLPFATINVIPTAPEQRGSSFPGKLASKDTDCPPSYEAVCSPEASSSSIGRRNVGPPSPYLSGSSSRVLGTSTYPSAYHSDTLPPSIGFSADLMPQTRSRSPNPRSHRAEKK